MHVRLSHVTPSVCFLLWGWTVRRKSKRPTISVADNDEVCLRLITLSSSHFRSTEFPSNLFTLQRKLNPSPCRTSRCHCVCGRRAPGVSGRTDVRHGPARASRAVGLSARREAQPVHSTDHTQCKKKMQMSKKKLKKNWCCLGSGVERIFSIFLQFFCFFRWMKLNC